MLLSMHSKVRLARGANSWNHGVMEASSIVTWENHRPETKSIKGGCGPIDTWDF